MMIFGYLDKKMSNRSCYFRLIELAASHKFLDTHHLSKPRAESTPSRTLPHAISFVGLQGECSYREVNDSREMNVLCSGGKTSNLIDGGCNGVSFATLERVK